MFIFQDPETAHSVSSADKNCVPNPSMKLVPNPVIKAVSSILLQDSGDKLKKLQEKGRNVFVWPIVV